MATEEDGFRPMAITSSNTENLPPCLRHRLAVFLSGVACTVFVLALLVTSLDLHGQGRPDRPSRSYHLSMNLNETEKYILFTEEFVDEYLHIPTLIENFHHTERSKKEYHIDKLCGTDDWSYMRFFIAKVDVQLEPPLAKVSELFQPVIGPDILYGLNATSVNFADVLTDTLTHHTFSAKLGHDGSVCRRDDTNIDVSLYTAFREYAAFILQKADELIAFPEGEFGTFEPDTNTTDGQSPGSGQSPDAGTQATRPVQAQDESDIDESADLVPELAERLMPFGVRFVHEMQDSTFSLLQSTPPLAHSPGVLLFVPAVQKGTSWIRRTKHFSIEFEIRYILADVVRQPHRVDPTSLKTYPCHHGCGYLSQRDNEYMIITLHSVLQSNDTADLQYFLKEDMPDDFAAMIDVQALQVDATLQGTLVIGLTTGVVMHGVTSVSYNSSLAFRKKTLGIGPMPPTPSAFTGRYQLPQSKWGVAAKRRKLPPKWKKFLTAVRTQATHRAPHDVGRVLTATQSGVKRTQVTGNVFDDPALQECHKLPDLVQRRWWT